MASDSTDPSKQLVSLWPRFAPEINGLRYLCQNGVTRPMLDDWEEELATVKLGADDAPLMLAIRRAISAIFVHHQVQRARFELITITGGPDTCNPRAFAEFLATMKRDLADAGLNQIDLPLATN